MAMKHHLYSENFDFNGGCSAYNDFAFNQPPLTQQQHLLPNMMQQQQQQPLQFVTQQQLRLPNVTQQQLSVQNVTQQQSPMQNMMQQQQQQLPLQEVKQQQQQLQNQFNGNQNLMTDNGDLFSVSKDNNNYFQSAFARNLVSQVEKQRQDMERYINLQGEEFKSVIQQQLLILIKEMQSNLGMILKRKDEELAEYENKTKELENFVIELESENLAWKKIAIENEGLILQLNNKLQQLHEKCARFDGLDNEADDVVSYCDENMVNLQLCKGCNSENASIIFLPCSHLCACKACEGFFNFCPVCSMKKVKVIKVVLV